MKKIAKVVFYTWCWIIGLIFVFAVGSLLVSCNIEVYHESPAAFFYAWGVVAFLAIGFIAGKIAED